ATMRAVTAKKPAPAIMPATTSPACPSRRALSASAKSEAESIIPLATAVVMPVHRGEMRFVRADGRAPRPVARSVGAATTKTSFMNGERRLRGSAAPSPAGHSWSCSDFDPCVDDAAAVAGRQRDHRIEIELDDLRYVDREPGHAEQQLAQRVHVGL